MAFVYAAVLAGAASVWTLSTPQGVVLHTSAPASAASIQQTLATADDTPARVLLVPRRELLPGSTVMANTLRLSGITVPVGVAVASDGIVPQAEVSIAGGPYTSAPTVAERGQPIVVRAVAPATGQSGSVTLTTGTLATSWTLTSTPGPVHTHQTLYGPWGACSAAMPCDGLGSQSREVLCLRSDGRFVEVGACDPGLSATQTRSCPSPAGSIACVPRPVLAIGSPTQYCAAGSSVRSTCSGFTCPAPYAPEDGACVSTAQSLPVLSIAAPAGVSESDGAVTLTLSADYAPLVDLELTVRVSADGTAAEADLAETGPWLLILPTGQTHATLTLPLAQDAVSEPQETLVLEVGAPAAGGASLAPGAGRVEVTLRDSGPLPRVSLGASHGTVTEGADPVTVTVALDRDSARSLSVPLVLSGPGATRARLSSPSVSFPPLTRIATVTLDVIQDALDQADAPLSLAIGAIAPADGATAGAALDLTLRDDDPAPTVSLSADRSSATEGDVIRLTATLGAVSGQAVSVPWSLDLAGTVTAGDVSVSSGSFTIPAGASSAFVEVTVTDEFVLEAAVETLTFRLGAAINASAAATPVSVTVAPSDPHPATCREHYDQRGARSDGTYTIDLDGFGPATAISVECTMSVAPGGWTRIFDGVNTSYADVAKFPILYDTASGTWTNHGTYGVSFGSFTSVSSWGTGPFRLRIAFPYDQMRVTYSGFYNLPSGGLGLMWIGNQRGDQIIGFTDAHTDNPVGHSLSVGGSTVFTLGTTNIVNRTDTVTRTGSTEVWIEMNGYTSAYPYTRRHIRDLWVR